jgi:hypothetical protein
MIPPQHRVMAVTAVVSPELFKLVPLRALPADGDHLHGLRMSDGLPCRWILSVAMLLRVVVLMKMHGGVVRNCKFRTSTPEPYPGVSSSALMGWLRQA